MDKYKHYIDKILKLEYKNSKMNYNSNDTDILRFVNRIGNSYSIEHNLINEVTIHINSICTAEPECNKCGLNKFCEYYRRKISTIPKDGYKIVDLFCGSGGFSLGFVQEGFNIIFAIDNQPCCIDTYICNHPEIPEDNILCKDIEDAFDDMQNILNEQHIDVIIGGPPCQGFSTANRQRIINDPRNKLYKQFVNSINLLSPKIFVMENVSGILSISKQIIEDFKNINYKVQPLKINATDFGVPQNRKRVLFIGTRLNIDLNDVINRIMRLANKNKKTVLNDAISGLRNLKANTEKNATIKDSVDSGSVIEVNTASETNTYIDTINQGKINKYVFNHKARYNNKRDIEIFTKLNPGDKSNDPKIADIMPYKSRDKIFKDKYYRLIGDKPCKTITAHMKFDGNMYIHPSQARGLSPREAARIQSYPDDYIFCGPYTKTYMQIGNSVPPLVSRTIAKIIKNVLEEYQNK